MRLHSLRLAILCGLMIGPSVVQAELLVFAAASLKEPIDSAAAAFDGVTVSYGSSATLARQIAAGAPADVVILAHPDWISYLAERDLIQGKVADIATNALVVLGHGGPLALTPDAITARLDGGRLAIGAIDSVPAGIYAREALENLGLWDAVADHLAEAENARATLALVTRGETPMGIVYATDQRVAPALDVLAEIPSASHSPIVYQAAQVSGNPAAAPFIAFLSGPEGRDILSGAGYGLPAEAAH